MLLRGEVGESLPLLDSLSYSNTKQKRATCSGKGLTCMCDYAAGHPRRNWRTRWTLAIHTLQKESQAYTEREIFFLIGARILETMKFESVLSQLDSADLE